MARVYKPGQVDHSGRDASELRTYDWPTIEAYYGHPWTMYDTVRPRGPAGAGILARRQSSEFPSRLRRHSSFMVLASADDDAVFLTLQDALCERKISAHLDDLAFQQQVLAFRSWPQAIHGNHPGDTSVEPEVFLADRLQGDRGTHVEDGALDLA